MGAPGKSTTQMRACHTVCHLLRRPTCGQVRSYLADGLEKAGLASAGAVPHERAPQFSLTLVRSIQSAVFSLLCTTHFHVAYTKLRAAALDILSTLSGDPTAMSSYKAPWRKATAANAFRTTSMYEAGCNILWVDPGLVDTGIPLEDPGWQAICELAVLFGGTAPAASRPDSGGVAPATRDTRGVAPATTDGGGVAPATRVAFPLMLEGYGDNGMAMCQEWFNGSVRLLGGHPIVQAWYLEMFRVLQRPEHPERLRLLRQCGLTVTLRVVILEGDAAIMLQSMMFSERLKLH